MCLTPAGPGPAPAEEAELSQEVPNRAGVRKAGSQCSSARVTRFTAALPFWAVPDGAACPRPGTGRSMTGQDRGDKPMATFDARPIIAAGGQPFSAIMTAVAALGQGEELVVLAQFDPVPLKGVLGSQGLACDAASLGTGD